MKHKLTGGMKACYKLEAHIYYAMIRKYKIRKAALATAFSLLLCLPVYSLQAEDKPTPVVVAEVQKVFKVTARTSDGKTMYTATAFYVGSTTLATAAHTFKKTSDQWIVKDGREVHCRLAKIDYKLDLALLECDEANSAWYRLVGDVMVIGFPNGGAQEASTGKICNERVYAKVGKFVPGMSGGPVVNCYGDVEGVGVQNDLGGKGNVCKFIPASVLADFLTRK